VSEHQEHSVKFPRMALENMAIAYCNVSFRSYFPSSHFCSNYDEQFIDLKSDDSTEIMWNLTNVM
jgi:hypothetical protein